MRRFGRKGIIDRRPAGDCPDHRALRHRCAVLPLTVRGGGHNIAGHSTLAADIVFDPGAFNQVGVDAADGLLTVGPGAISQAGVGWLTSSPRLPGLLAERLLTPAWMRTSWTCSSTSGIRPSSLLP